MFRSFVAVAALTAAPLLVGAADEENPFKKVKVGDYGTYAMSTKVAAFSFTATVTQTVTKKDDKEVTLETTGKADFNGKQQDLPAQTQKIDLTKPFDPTKGGNLPPGAETKVEKGKEGKEKIKVNGKEYDCTWTTYKVKAKVMGQEIESDVKAWTSKDVSTALVKMTTTGDVGGQKMEMTMELKETGNKKPKE
jgi:hypothetical protein